MSDSLHSQWTIARQAPLSMGYSTDEYWSEMSFPSPGDLLGPGIKPESPELQADSFLFEPLGFPQKTCPSPSPQHRWNVTLLENRVFAEVPMTWPSDILDSGCILNPMTGVFISDTQRGRPCEDGNRDCSDVSLSWGIPRGPRSLKRKRSILSWRLCGQHGLMAPQTPWLWLQASRTVREKTSIAWSHQICGTLLGQL